MSELGGILTARGKLGDVQGEQGRQAVAYGDGFLFDAGDLGHQVCQFMLRTLIGERSDSFFGAVRRLLSSEHTTVLLWIARCVESINERLPRFLDLKARISSHFG